MNIISSIKSYFADPRFLFGFSIVTMCASMDCFFGLFETPKISLVIAGFIFAFASMYLSYLETQATEKLIKEMEES